MDIETAELVSLQATKDRALAYWTNISERHDMYTIEPLDPEWTCFIQCPFCPARTLACCPEHARDAMDEHVAENH